MSRLLPAGVFKAGIAAMAVLVAVPGALIGIAQPAGAASTAAVTHPIDHLLCYKVSSSPPYSVPSPVTLKNQFSPGGFVPQITDIPTVHCNPVQKTVPTGVFKITHAAAHELCYPIAEATQPTPNVVVTNQFGQATLSTAQPTTLCLPTWKSLNGPPNKTPSQPSGLDHLTCYPVQYIAGGGTFAPPTPISLKDQFGTANNVQVGNPVSLCLPTTKIIPPGTTFKMHFPTQHYLCFQVSPTPMTSQVFDQNQFGTRQIFLQPPTLLLCVPSSKTIVQTVTHVGNVGDPVMSHVGQAVTFTATVNPTPTGGTVSWTDAGVSISGCKAVPVDTSTGHATCNTSFNTVGTHPIVAHYSGNNQFAKSHSSTLKYQVT